MRIVWTLMLVLAGFSNCARAGDKTSPDFLRHEHAGTARLASEENVASLFPKLLRATQECWIGEVAAGAMGIPVSSASRTVLGAVAPDGASAYIIIRAKGFFGALQTNFLQIDLSKESDGTRLDVYYKNDVKGQREFVGEVEHWLKGELTYCDAQPFMRKPKHVE